MNKRFDEQVKEFSEEQKQIHDLKARAKKLEQGKLDRRREITKLDGELDQIPTREFSKPSSSVPTKSAKSPKKAARPTPTYNPNRVKSSIPGTSASVQKVIAEREKRKANQKKAEYIEELKKAEVKRAVTIE